MFPVQPPSLRVQPSRPRNDKGPCGVLPQGAAPVFGENLSILPANFDLAAYRRELATLDALRPRLARRSKLSQSDDDTQMAVGSDLMTKGAGGLALPNVTGKEQGVDDLRKMLPTRCSLAARARLRRPSRRPILR